MELVQAWCGRNVERVIVAPIGDIQWSGENGSTAIEHLERHIARCLALHDPKRGTQVRFIGMGDYTDFASPSNRARLQAANLYDTAQEVMEDAANNLVAEVFKRFLAPTKGMWIGLLEGHHFFEFGGRTSDTILAEMLDTKFLGTSCFANIQPVNVTLWAHHGCGGGTLPSAPLNKLYHVEAGIEGADVYMIGHTTKMPAVRMSRMRPDFSVQPPTLKHRDVHLVNTGGFSKSNVLGHRRGGLPRGDYAEQGMMTPSALTSPLIYINAKAKHAEERVRVEI